MTMQRKFGWRPDVPDHRDYRLAPLPPRKLPARVSNIGPKIPIDDQGEFNSCTGNASTAALEILTKSPQQFSRMMAYYNGRLRLGIEDVDDGCTIRDVVKALSKEGVCNETTWDYTRAHLFAKPNASAVAEAVRMVSRIQSYERVTDLAGLRTALARRRPVLFGFAVPDYFVYEDLEHGVLRLPTNSDPIAGGHAVLAVGYNAAVKKPYVLVRNSWGEGWGLRGYFKMPFAWFTDPRRLVDDLWVIEAR